MDSILERMRSGNWVYGDGDPVAMADLERRIEEVGKAGDLVTYGDLVRNVNFCLSNVHGGEAFQMDFRANWRLYSAIIGEFLGRMSTKSYEQAGFMASALVVSADSQIPSPQFFKWMREIGALLEAGEEAELAFWSDQVKQAHQYYGQFVE